MAKTEYPAYSNKERLLYLAAAGAICLLGFLLVGLGGNAFYRVFPVEDFLPFHLTTEFASVIVSFAVFTVGWYGYKQQSGLRNLAIALTFLAVGLLDFIHTLSYKGMPDFFSENSVSKAATYWIAARIIFSVGLLGVALIPPVRPPRWLRPRLLLGIVTALIFSLIMVESYTPGLIPPMYVEGEGLTQLKNVLEYLVIGLNAATILILWKKPVLWERSTFFLQMALLVSIFSEIAFTMYASAYDSYNFLGHVYKAAAYYLILQAIFVSSLQEPYFQLNKTRENLERSFNSIGMALSSSLELDKTLRLIIQLASDVLRSPHSMIALRQEDPENLNVLATRGVDITPPLIPLKGSLAGEAWRDRKPFIIDDLDTTPILVPPRIPNGKIRSAVAAPVLTSTTILGVLSVYSQKPGAFGQREAKLLAAFARHAAVAIENASLYESQLATRAKIQNYAVKLSILHNIGLTLNTQTDQSRLLETILKGSVELTSAGVGAMVLHKDGKTFLGPVYYAPWYKKQCTIGKDVTFVHRRITRLAADAGKDTVRIANLDDLEKQFRFPAGHLKLRGLLIGTIRGTRSQIRGNIMLSDKINEADFTPEDEEIISLLAAQSSVALTSAENFEREHYVAETLQASLLPPVPARDDMEVGLLYRSAGLQGRVGGDFYDFIELGKNRIAVAVGDVCGKGLEAATYTAMIKYMLRAYLGEGLLPGDCLTRLNRAVHKEVSLDKFVTVGLALIDTSRGTVTYSSAGHPPPIICQDGQANPLYLPTSIPLGVLQSRTFKSSQITPAGDCSIVMYTDGLIEARPDGGKPLGQKRLGEILAGLGDLPAQQLVDSVLKAAVEYSGGGLKDDIALLVVRLPKAVNK